MKSMDFVHHSVHFIIIPQMNYLGFIRSYQYRNFCVHVEINMNQETR